MSASVLTPGLTCAPIISSTLAAKRPARRMPSMSASVVALADMGIYGIKPAA
ncbi:MAG: hypothetical protein OXE83_00820 [Gammaproteobacteria bacterium]|nr:hypothetical protein [Gammaproteobacteria bacterium]